KLFERAAHGISFSGKTKEQVGKLIKEMELQFGFKRLMTLLEVLNVLGTSKNYTSLNASQLTFEVNSQDYDRVQKIYNHVEHHFLDHIALEEMAELINMTVPAFCRYFKKLTGKTFTQFVNEFRVDYACKLLSEPENTIANICFESGFNNISHFNKQFKQIAGVTPRQYRYNLKKVVAHNAPSNQLEYEEKV
ncbi:MAG: AraC family transcriptional regulator, partial [Bacteroidota bacterium]